MSANMSTIKLKNYKQFQSYIYNMGDGISCAPEVYVYKIMPFKYFLKLLQTKKLYFCNVMHNWEDPYELILFNQDYYDGKNALDFSDVKSRFYGQAWSFARDSDALWRIYSNPPCETGVRIKTSFQKIYNLFYNESTDKDYVPYIGKVTYKAKKEIKTWIAEISQNCLLDHTGESLFMKRNNFSHEEEFRIILQSPSVGNGNKILPNKEFIEVPIDINDFIYEVAFDPRLDDDTYNCLKTITSYYMSSNKRIMRSTLYKEDKPQRINLS